MTKPLGQNKLRFLRVDKIYCDHLGPPKFYLALRGKRRHVPQHDYNFAFFNNPNCLSLKILKLNSSLVNQRLDQ